MCRLVSGYYQKFIKLAKHGTWAPKIRLIIARYRDKPNTGDQVHPSPQEFIRYTHVTNVRNGESINNQHCNN